MIKITERNESVSRLRSLSSKTLYEMEKYIQTNTWIRVEEISEIFARVLLHEFFIELTTILGEVCACNRGRNYR